MRRTKAGASHGRSIRDVDPTVIRAVTKTNVCVNEGYQFRSGSGGDEATYGLSFQTEELDIFLSHSWRDSGFLKYVE